MIFFKKSERTINIPQKFVNSFSLDSEVAFLFATFLNVFADLKPLPTIQTNLNLPITCGLAKQNQKNKSPKLPAT